LRIDFIVPGLGVVQMLKYKFLLVSSAVLMHMKTVREAQGTVTL
jgi:hypothetical protein